MVWEGLAEDLPRRPYPDRRHDAALDLSFVREVLAPFYTPGWGRPSVDPELALRMMILGVVYDLSDRRLCDEVRMHAGFRLFCRLNFHDSVPSHSKLSRLRNERWTDSDIFTRLFEEVLGHCVSAGIVSGRHVSVDGTQIRANASMKSMERDQAPSPDSSDPAAETSGSESDEEEATDREDPVLSLVGVEPPTPKEEPAEPKPAGDWRGHRERYSNQTHTSTTDPDARLYRKGRNQGASLSFLVHDVIDTKSRVILGRRASVATSRAEREVTLELLSEHEERREGLGLKQAVEVLTGDTGYGAGDFCGGSGGAGHHATRTAFGFTRNGGGTSLPAKDIQSGRAPEESGQSASSRGAQSGPHRVKEHRLLRQSEAAKPLGTHLCRGQERTRPGQSPAPIS